MRISKRTLIVATTIFAVMMLLPGALAQTVTPDSTNTRKSLTPIKPEIETGSVTLAWNYNFNTNAHTASGLYQSTPAASVNIRCASPEIVVVGPQTVGISINPSGSAGETSFPFSAQYTVSVSRNLPGLKQFRCDYDVDVPEIFPQTVNAINGEGKDNFLVSAAYYGLVQAKTESQIQQAGPQKDVPFNIQLENFGNARTTIQFEINERPEGGRWVAAVPDDVILYSPTDPVGAVAGQAVFTITTPYKTGWNNDQGAYRLKMSTFASDDIESQGQDYYTNVIVRVRGVYVPGLEPVALLGAILGTALIARVRRDEE